MVPVINIHNGDKLSGVATVARYLSQTGTVHTSLSLEEQAAVDQWLEYCVTRIHPHLHNKNITHVFKVLNCYLSNKTYMVTSHPTVADVILYHNVHHKMVNFGHQEKEQYIHLSRWFDNIQQDDTVRQSLPLLPFSRTQLYS